MVVIWAMPPEVALTEVVEGDLSDAKAYEPFGSESGVIVRNHFDYAERNYDAFWTTNETAGSVDYSTACNDSIASLQETPGSTSSNPCISVCGLLDLSRWTGTNNLKLEARVRVRCSVLGGNSPDFRVGIGSWTPEDYWTSYISWSDVNDTGWLILEFEVPEAALQSGDSYRFSWGFRDSSDDGSHLTVELDYIEFRGQSYPSDTLQVWRGCTVSRPVTLSFIYDQGEDSDLVGLTCVSTIDPSSPGPLGIASGWGPCKTSAVCVSLDPDVITTLTPGFGPFQARSVCYSLVDSVSIMTGIVSTSNGFHVEAKYDFGHNNYVMINEPIPDASSQSPAMSGILGLAAESLSLTPDVTEYTSVVNETVYYRLLEPPNLDTRLKWNTSCVMFDYPDSANNLVTWDPSEGSTSLLLESEQCYVLTPADSECYRITVLYQIALKHVRVEYSGWSPTPVRVDESMTRYSIADAFDFLAYDDTDLLHVVDISAPLQNMVNLSAGNNVHGVEPTVNGENWSVVYGESPTENATVTIAANQTYVDGGVHSFTGYLISYWDDYGFVRSEYVEDALYILVLEPSCRYCCVQPLYD